MSELLKLRDNYLYFSGGFHLGQLDIATLIDNVATVLFAYALVCFCCMHYIICTTVPWQSGHCATWDVTVVHTLAASYVSQSAVQA